MAGEQAIDESDLVGEENAEAEAQNTGTGNEPAIEPGKSSASVRKRQSQGASNQHHSRNRS